MRAAAIYRVSTEKQVRREGDESLPIQRAAVRAFIASRPGWSLVREYAEEGVSGFKQSAAERDVLQQAYTDAKAGLFQAVVLFKADRLSRNAFEYPVIIDRFRRIGCEIWSVKDGPDGRCLALDTQMDKFIRFLEGWQAETESQNTSIRVSEAMRQLARQGRWSGGPPPFGYRLNPERRPRSDLPALLIDPVEAEVIRLMVALYLEERLGCIQIAQELNRRGIINPTGRPWDDQRVRRILQNPIIAGLPAYERNRPAGRGYSRQNPYDLARFILPRDEVGNLRPVPAYQIIPLERWERMLQLMASVGSAGRAGAVRHTLPAQQRAGEALLTGLLFCGHCGARLAADGCRSKAQRQDGSWSVSTRRYYICQSQARRGRGACDGQRTYGQKRLDGLVLAQLEQLLARLDPGELATRLAREAENGRGELAGRIRQAEAQMQRTERVLQGWLSRMDSLLADPAGSPYSEELLAERIRESRERWAASRAGLAALHQEAEAQAVPDLVRKPALTWWDCFQAAPRAEQKLVLRELIDRVVVRRGEVEIHLRVAPDQLGATAQEQPRPSGAAAPVGSSRQTARPSSPAPSP